MLVAHTESCRDETAESLVLIGMASDVGARRFILQSDGFAGGEMLFPRETIAVTSLPRRNLGDCVEEGASAGSLSVPDCWGFWDEPQMSGANRILRDTLEFYASILGEPQRWSALMRLGLAEAAEFVRVHVGHADVMQLLFSEDTDSAAVIVSAPTPVVAEIDGSDTAHVARFLVQCERAQAAPRFFGLAQHDRRLRDSLVDGWSTISFEYPVMLGLCDLTFQPYGIGQHEWLLIQNWSGRSTAEEYVRHISERHRVTRAEGTMDALEGLRLSRSMG
ncbi:MAG: hypothetical protein D8M53_01625 [Armatimonadetes bacterium]|nr:hypothetical protein [Armatimonadota bacterium]